MNKFIAFLCLIAGVALGAPASINQNPWTTNNAIIVSNITASLITGGQATNSIDVAAGTNVVVVTNVLLRTLHGLTDTNVVNALAAVKTNGLAIALTNQYLGLHANADTATSANNSTNFWGQLSPTNFNHGTSAGVGTWLRGDGTWVSPGVASGAPWATVASVGDPSVTIVTNSAGGTNNYSFTVNTNALIGVQNNWTASNYFGAGLGGNISSTTASIGTANITNAYGLISRGNVTNESGFRIAYLDDTNSIYTAIGNAGVAVTNAGNLAFLTADQHFSGKNQFSGSNNYTGTLVLEGAVRIDDGSLIATNMTARTNQSGSSALTTYGDVQVIGDITNTGTIHGSAGQFHSPVTTTSSSSNSPSALEFTTASWVRSLFNNGLIDYATSNIDNTATNPATLNQVVYQFWQGVIPQSSVRTWASGFITNNGYIGSIITTNTFTVLDGTLNVNAFLGATTAGSLNNFFLTMHPEIYYSYDKTNWLGDYTANAQPITGNATNLYSWVVTFPTIIATNPAGFYVQRRLKVDTASTAGNVPTVYFMVGTNLVSGNANASHISISGPNSALGNAYLGNNQTFTGTNTFTVGTRTFLHDSAHTLITNTATLTSSEWTAGSQKEWYNGTATMTIDKTNGQITALSYKGLPPRTVGITIDGGGSAIALGTKGYIVVPYACTIQAAYTLCDTAGSIAVEVWRTNSTDGNFPPTRAGAIGTNGTATSQQKLTDSTLTGWTTGVNAGDVLGFNVTTNCAAVTRCTFQLKVQP